MRLLEERGRRSLAFAVLSRHSVQRYDGFVLSDEEPVAFRSAEKLHLVGGLAAVGLERDRKVGADDSGFSRRSNCVAR